MENILMEARIQFTVDLRNLDLDNVDDFYKYYDVLTPDPTVGSTTVRVAEDGSSEEFQFDIKKEPGDLLGIEVEFNEQGRTAVVRIEPDGWIHYLNQWWKARRRPTVKLGDYIVAINGKNTYNN